MFHSINCLLGPTVDRTYHLLATKIEEERLQGRERVRYQRAEDKERGRKSEKKDRDPRANYLVFSFSLRTLKRLSKGQKLSNALLIGANTPLHMQCASIERLTMLLAVSLSEKRAVDLL